MGKFKYELGVRLRDKVSEVEGIVIGRIEYLNGCMQYAIKPKKAADGKVYEAEWIDSQQVEFVDKGVSEDIDQEETGGAQERPRL